MIDRSDISQNKTARSTEETNSRVKNDKIYNKVRR